MFLGAVKAGTQVKYRSVWDKADTTVQDPTVNSARLESPSGVFTNLSTPVKIDAQTGYFGGTVDTTGFASGQWTIRQQGTTDKVKSTVFVFQVVAYDPADATGLGLSRLDAAVSGVAAAVWAYVTRTLTNYIAPDNAGIAAIKAKTNNLPVDPASISDAHTTRDAVLMAIMESGEAVITAIPPSPSLITSYLGDLPPEGVFYHKFHTLLNGTPASLTGVILEVYKNGDLTPVGPEGVTLITDFNGLPGLNQVSFDLTGPLYEAHANFAVVIKEGMLGGALNMADVTIVSFSIGQRMCRINWGWIDRQ